VLAAIPLGRDGTVAASSSSGRKLGFGVPGEEIMTTNSGGGYRVDAGLAAPGLLAGAVALVRAAYPNLPPDEIVHRLSSTAEDAGAKGADTEYGQGKLNLVAALTRTVPLLHTAGPSAPVSASAHPSASTGATAIVVSPRGLGGWLLFLPLLVVLLVLIGVAIQAERRLPDGSPDGSATRESLESGVG
jgi:hypothetical protein